MTGKRQTIFRRAHDSEFVVVGNDLARDVALSHRARGILLWLLSYPADWDIRLDALVTERDGPAAVRAAVEELEDAGYIVRDQARQQRGRFGAGFFIVHETPVPVEQRSGAERRERAAQRAAHSPYAILPHTVAPQHGPPHAVAPFAVNRTLQKTDKETKTEEPKTEHTKDRVAEAGASGGGGNARAPAPAAQIRIVDAVMVRVCQAWEHIGGTVKPHVAEFLRRAVAEYGEEMVTAAIREMGETSSAVSVRYVQRILDACRRDGRRPGEKRKESEGPVAGFEPPVVRTVTTADLEALRRKRTGGSPPSTTPG